MWSIGVILYILLSGEPPFRGDDIESQFELVKTAEVEFSKDCWKETSSAAKDLVRRLLCKEPDKRITLEEAIAHEWISNSDVASSVANAAILTNLTTSYGALKKRFKNKIHSIIATNRMKLFGAAKGGGGIGNLSRLLKLGLNKGQVVKPKAPLMSPKNHVLFPKADSVIIGNRMGETADAKSFTTPVPPSFAGPLSISNRASISKSPAYSEELRKHSVAAAPSKRTSIASKSSEADSALNTGDTTTAPRKSFARPDKRSSIAKTPSKRPSIAK